MAATQLQNKVIKRRARGEDTSSQTGSEGPGQPHTCLRAEGRTPGEDASNLGAGLPDIITSVRGDVQMPRDGGGLLEPQSCVVTELV